MSVQRAVGTDIDMKSEQQQVDRVQIGDDKQHSSSSLDSAIGPIRRNKRKALQPRKAPSKVINPDIPTTPSVNVSLLLRALLREAERDPNPSNLRSGSSSTSSSQQPRLTSTKGSDPKAKGKNSPAKMKKRERDLLPPPQAGYGRGKRSTSAALSSNEYDLGGDDQAATATASTPNTRKRVFSNTLQVPSSAAAASSRSRQAATLNHRSRSIEPSLNPQSSSPSEAHHMTRASSLGPGPMSHYSRPNVLHHHAPYGMAGSFHHHPHQPSPLMHQTPIMAPVFVEHQAASMPQSPLANSFTMDVKSDS